MPGLQLQGGGQDPEQGGDVIHPGLWQNPDPGAWAEQIIDDLEIRYWDRSFARQVLIKHLEGYAECRQTRSPAP